MSKARDIADSAATINALDGVTTSAAELNKITGLTADSTELNTLDAMGRGSIIYGNASGQTTALAAGAANTVLKSDGSDLSWGDISGVAGAAGGTEAEFVATGAIASGAMVGLRSDGTVEAIGSSSVADTITSEYDIPGNRGLDRIHCRYDKVNDRILVAETNYSNAYFYVGKVDATTGAITFSTNAGWISQTCNHESMTYDESQNMWVYMYQASASQYIYFATISAPTTGAVTGWTLTINSGLWGSDPGVAGIGIAYDPYYQRNLIYYSYGPPGNSYYSVCKALTITGPSSVTVSATRYAMFSYYSFTSAAPCFAVDHNNTLWMTAAHYDSQTGYYPVCTTHFSISSSTGTPGNTTIYKMLPNNYQFADAVAMAFGDTDDNGVAGVNELIVAGVENATGTYIHYFCGYQSNGTATSPSLNLNVGAVNRLTRRHRGQHRVHMTYSKEANKWFYVFQTHNTAQWLLHKVEYQSSNQSIAVTQFNFFNGDNNGDSPNQIDITNDHWTLMPHKDGSTGRMAVKNFRYAFTSTNNASFIGQAKDAIANTATGKVTLPGGVATGFTGLTPNGTVYLQGDGTVSNSSASTAVEIGKSYNATTVLLKGI